MVRGPSVAKAVYGHGEARGHGGGTEGVTSMDAVMVWLGVVGKVVEGVETVPEADSVLVDVRGESVVGRASELVVAKGNKDRWRSSRGLDVLVFVVDVSVRETTRGGFPVCVGDVCDGDVDGGGEGDVVGDGEGDVDGDGEGDVVCVPGSDKLIEPVVLVVVECVVLTCVNSSDGDMCELDDALKVLVGGVDVVQLDVTKLKVTVTDSVEHARCWR